MMPKGLRTGAWMFMFLAVCGVSVASANGTLIDAARAGDRQGMKALLLKGADANATDRAGHTALHFAVQRSDVQMVDLLLKAKADVRAANKYGVFPLELAAVNGDAEIIDQLVKAGADVNTVGPGGQTPLMSAARTGIVRALDILIAHGANVNARQAETGQTALMWAVVENNVDAVRTLLRAGTELEAYSGKEAIEAKESRFDSVKLVPTKKERMIGLLSAYHSTFDYGDQSAHFTPLHFAVRAGSLEATKVLVEAGADVNKPVVLGRAGRGSIGMSPLLLATHNANYEVAAYLLEKGADPNFEAAGFTALHQVARLRGPYLKMMNLVPNGRLDSLELARRLLVAGANPNAIMKRDFQDGYRNRINWQGATPIMVAAKYIDIELLRLLVAYGANPDVKNVDGLSPLMVACGVSVWNPGEDFGTTREDDARALEVAQFLVSLGNDPDAVAWGNGETPLHGAAYTGRNSLVQYLVDLGVRMDLKNVIGWTPLRIADGVHYAAFAKYQPHTAVLLRELLGKRGLPVPPPTVETELFYLEANAVGGVVKEEDLPEQSKEAPKKPEGQEKR